MKYLNCDIFSFFSLIIMGTSSGGDVAGIELQDLWSYKIKEPIRLFMLLYKIKTSNHQAIYTGFTIESVFFF